MDTSHQEMMKKPVKKIRRIGTVTAGTMLILYGILFLVHSFLPVVDYRMIFNFWPVIFILLGTEILFGIGKEGTEFKYDGGAVFLILVMTFFAMGMAGADWFMDCAEKYHYIHFN